MHRSFRMGMLLSMVSLVTCISAGHEPKEIIELMKQWDSQVKTDWQFTGNLVADGAVYRRLRVVEAIELGDATSPASGYATIVAKSGAIEVMVVDRQNSSRSAISLRLDESGYALSFTDGNGRESIGIRRTATGDVSFSGADIETALKKLLSEIRERKP